MMLGHIWGGCEKPAFTSNQIMMAPFSIILTIVILLRVEVSRMLQNIKEKLNVVGCCFREGKV
jgi:hypothetical protein